MKGGFLSTIRRRKDRVLSSTVPSLLDQRRFEWANQRWNRSSLFFLTLKVLSIRSLYHSDRQSTLHFMWKCLNGWRKVARVRPEIANIWVLHHDIAPSHASLLVREFLAKQTVATLPQPPYSPDLSPPDFFLLPQLKSSLKGHHFGTVKNVLQAAMTNALQEIPVQDFQASYNAWQNRWQQCIDAQGCYFEEY